MKNILLKLQTIQTQLKAPKTQRNDFGKYDYRSCEDILEAIKPLLLRTKTTILLQDEIVEVGGRNYVKALVTLYDNESDEYICGTASAREEESKKGMDGSQITGASSSYARKYALNGLFAIDDTKDSDATNKHDKGQKHSEIAPDRVKLTRLLTAEDKLQSTLDFYKVDTVEQIDDGTVIALLKRLGA
jgi:hypothetical protein